MTHLQQVRVYQERRQIVWPANSHIKGKIGVYCQLSDFTLLLLLVSLTLANLLQSKQDRFALNGVSLITFNFD